jgi:hypothetical protein
MSKVTAFTYRAKAEDLERAEQCLAVLEAESAIFNIPTHRVEDHISQNSVILTFGRLARIEVQQYIDDKKLPGVRLVDLPHTKQLSPESVNRESRLSTYKKLRELRDLLKAQLYYPTSVVVKSADLPELDTKQLLLLSKMTEDAGETSCFQATKGGKLIEISNAPIEDSKADIHLTFQEVYTIRAVMDILKVTEVQLVTYPQASSNQPNEDTP